MNTINLQHAGWADLLDEIRSISPDFDAVHRRTKELIREKREGPARDAVLRTLGLVNLGEVA